MTAQTTRPPAILPGFVLTGGGYVIAVLTASLIVNAQLALWTGSRDGVFVYLFAIGCAYTFACALPGFIATVLAARRLGFQSPFFFILAGGLDSLLSLWIFGTFWEGGGALLDESFSFFAITGGLAGGLAYWLVAYRRRDRAA